MLVLTDFQQDVISELFNIGMGSAAASLSQMVGETVGLSVPSVEYIGHTMAVKRIQDIVGSQEVTGVKESFKGSFWGDALLIFPEDRSRELVRALLKDQDLPLETITEMEQEALTEVGNIILNACLGSLANVFQQNLIYGLPQYTQGDCEELLGANMEQQENDGLLLLHMDFILQETNINGYLTLLMNVDSVKALSDQIDLYLAELV
ncbi:MAG: chemotaxis protein CheC [Pseudomonadales bacterium]|nr:chemotaxis protein CheC [Pseudomonadales bacterium]NRA17034.1 chemotaxis protein CheC [Oceanospirillaceae bacterium]